MDNMPDTALREGSGMELAGAINELSEKILLVELLNKAKDEEMTAFLFFLEEIRLLQDRLLDGQGGLWEEIVGMIRILHFDLDNTLMRQRS